MRSSSENVRPCRLRRAWAKKAAPYGSILRITGCERVPTALKLVLPSSPFHSEERLGIVEAALADILSAHTLKYFAGDLVMWNVLPEPNFGMRNQGR
jgi:hypothetical protein